MQFAGVEVTQPGCNSMVCKQTFCTVYKLVCSDPNQAVASEHELLSAQEFKNYKETLHKMLK